MLTWGCFCSPLGCCFLSKGNFLIKSASEFTTAYGCDKVKQSRIETAGIKEWSACRIYVLQHVEFGPWRVPLGLLGHGFPGSILLRPICVRVCHWCCSGQLLEWVRGREPFAPGEKGAHGHLLLHRSSFTAPSVKLVETGIARDTGRSEGLCSGCKRPGLAAGGATEAFLGECR